MNPVSTIVHHLIEEGTAARAHFQVWWALRNLAIPEFLPAMNKLEYVDFFHASNSGHYKLIFFALSKIFDRNPKSSGFASLKSALRADGQVALADHLDVQLSALTDRVVRIQRIRNQTIAHNQTDRLREDVYEENGTAPNDIRDVVDATCSLINHVARELGISEIVFTSKRFESATLAMLKALRGEHNKPLQATCEDARA